MRLFGRSNMCGVVTLIFETEELRFLATEAGRVAKWGSVPLPERLVYEGLITNVIEMGGILDDLFEQQDLDRARVMTGVSARRAVPRMITVPRLRASALEETVCRVAEEEMPVSLDDLYLSWQSVSNVGDRQHMYVYLLGVPRKLIEAQVRSLQAAGIRPLAMDLNPLALVRAVAQSEAIIVSLEAQESDILIVVDYLPVIMRTVSFVGQEIEQQTKRDRLLHELEQTVQFYNDGHDSAPIGSSIPVYVTGKLLSEYEATSYVAERIDRPVKRPTAPIDCPGELPVAEYLANFGLALKKV